MRSTGVTNDLHTPAVATKTELRCPFPAGEKRKQGEVGVGKTSRKLLASSVDLRFMHKTNGGFCETVTSRILFRISFEANCKIG